MTKNFLKSCNKIVLVGLALAALVAARAGVAVAGSNDERLLAEPDKTANVGYVTGGTIGSLVSSTTVMNLSYSGTAADAEVGITVAAGVGTKLCFYAPAATLATDVGGQVGASASGCFDLSVSSVSTFGQLADFINSSTSGYWHAKLVGVTRADSPANILATTKSQVAGIDSLAAVGGYSVPVGTNTYLALGITPAPGRRVVLKACLVNQAGTTVGVYGARRRYAALVDEFGNSVTDASQVWASVISANTLSYVPVYSQYTIAPWVEFATNQGFSRTAPPKGPTQYDGHVVVKASNYGAANAAQASTNYVQCEWDEK